MPSSNTLPNEKNLVLGGILVALMVSMALVAPWISPYDPIRHASLMDAELPPNAQYLLGTDSHGRDVLSRIIFGARVSLSVGLITQFINTCIGVSLGLLAGIYRGVVGRFGGGVHQYHAFHPGHDFCSGHHGRPGTGVD